VSCMHALYDVSGSVQFDRSACVIFKKNPEPFWLTGLAKRRGHPDTKTVGRLQSNYVECN